MSEAAGDMSWTMCPECMTGSPADSPDSAHASWCSHVGGPGKGAGVLTVNIRLDDLLFDPERGNTLSQAIVEQAAEQLLDGLRVEMITQARAHALSILNERLRALIEAMLTEAIEQSIQGTDYYGQPKGDPTTLHEVIVKRADAVLRERRESRGGYSRNAPLIEDIISSEIEQAWRRELQDAVAAARTDVLAAVKEQAAQVITDTIAKSVPR